MSRKDLPFHFKQFSIHQDKCAHKVGTDGTLLGAWVNLEVATRVLDIGTGSGLIALMAAQRTPSQAVIEAVELSQAAYEQAKENVSRTLWADKIKIHHTSIQEFTSTQQFDCIVSNPPFFNNSFKPPNKQRVAPRHTDTLSFESLLQQVNRLLTINGRFSLILPYTEGLQFINMANEYSFFVSRQCSFRTRVSKPIERWLLEFSRQFTQVDKNEILLYSKDEEWSDEYKLITREFYLKL
jgi:tRNA1Val (adenine37-N6)-methyltransferase